jgi:alpha-beta hydrolase superfamily lysophospholipase
MTPAYVVQITTPKKYILNGLWFGPKKAKKAIIFIHGLTASAFSMQSLVHELVDARTAVLTFNNRGFEQISEVKRKVGKKTQWLPAGAGHERFTDSPDDVQGAIDLAKKNGVKEICLAGHSTGCQKSVYWASKRKDPRVKGLLLLGPLSDYSGALATKGKRVVEEGVRYAHRLVVRGRPNELMPTRFSEWFPCDAQRYISLYSPESPEEIFSYSRPNRVPQILRNVDQPILILLAGADEHGDRPAAEIAAWFEGSLKKNTT